jgi:hypothetical protein
LILAEIWGGFLGLRAYKRSVRRVKSEALRNWVIERERVATPI